MCNSAINYPNRPNEKWVKFQKYSSCSCYTRADASKLTSLTSSTWRYMYAKQTKAKKRVFRQMNVKLRAAVFDYWMTWKVKGSPKLLKWPVLKIFSEFAVSANPNFFGRCVVEMIDRPRSVASLGEAMYQSAFLSLEFRLNTGKNLRDRRNCSVNYA